MIPGQVVCQDYQIIDKIGQGSFGYVYKVKHRTTHQFYALKTDQKSITKMELHNQVSILKQIQSKIASIQTNKQIQQKQTINIHLNKNNSINVCISYYLSQISCNKMIMPLFGQNLFNLFHKCNKKFDSQTIYQVAKQLLSNIQTIHNLGFIHRDIKPQNFVVGQRFNDKDKTINDNNIYLVDFGLAKPYKNSYNNNGQSHIPYQIGRKIRGTPMYMSVNVMLGIQPSRRDDLQSLIYIIVFFMKGRLPWHNLKITKKSFQQLIKVKISTHPDDLFLDLPSQLKQAFVYIRRLKFQQKPNYLYIFKSLESILSHRILEIEQQYNGKYRRYCWQRVYQKQNFLQVTQNLFKQIDVNFFQKLNSEKQYSLLN